MLSSSGTFSWRAFLSMRALRFQGMLLSVGLLVSLADFFDNSIGELAWLIFLVPLLAIYWLILLSIRLGEHTHALRQSLSWLLSTSVPKMDGFSQTLSTFSYVRCIHIGGMEKFLASMPHMKHYPLFIPLLA